MSHEPRSGAEGGAETFDRELSLPWIIVTALVLAVVVAASAALMWFTSDTLRARLVAADPPPPVLPEARMRWDTPGPRLQASPRADLDQMHAEEDAVLDTYGWVDEGAGIARIPVDRALDLVAANGLPSGATQEAAPAAEP